MSSRDDPDSLRVGQTRRIKGKTVTKIGLNKFEVRNPGSNTTTTMSRSRARRRCGYDEDDD